MTFSISFAKSSVSLRSDRVSADDAVRQERTAEAILARLEHQPGVILADEVGMGKTFVGLAVASSIALARPEDGPVVVMVPPSLKQKWPKDWAVFREHCLVAQTRPALEAASADSGVAFMRLLDDPPERRKAIIFLTHGALNRTLTDEWVKLALIRRALLRRTSLDHVRRALPRFAGRLLRSQWVDHTAPDLWERLLDNPPNKWRRLMKAAGLEGVADDDPVPAPLVEAMEHLELTPVLDALSRLPVRESAYITERLQEARQTLSEALAGLWRVWLRQTRFRSPLLIFDEAHHLKNVTKLSSLFAEEGAHEDSEAVSRGPLAGVFARMLFLTATPFQLGHHELVNVLRRFDGIAWDPAEAPAGGRAGFNGAVETLEQSLNQAQEASLRLERAWGRLNASHLRSDDGTVLTPDEWWRRLCASPPPDGLAAEVCSRYVQCRDGMHQAEALLRPWVIRHLKPKTLPRATDGTAPKRRELLIGAAINSDSPTSEDRGLEVDGDALLPFLLAARAQVALATKHDDSPRRAVFAEGLASSYEAYLETRRSTDTQDDEDAADASRPPDPEVAWYLTQLDRALPDEEFRARHPKLVATINRALDLWWNGEKSLIFCHYRATGRTLRRYVSRQLEERILTRAGEKLAVHDLELVRAELDRLSEQFFDTDGRLRSVAQALVGDIVSSHSELSRESQDRVIDIALRFLRTPSFLVRYFPLEQSDRVTALREAFDKTDASGLTLRQRLDDFCQFLALRCVEAERDEYLAALTKIQTGTFRREAADADDVTDEVRYLPNVRLANGEVPNDTRRRLMLAFNTPFFPEILIASSVLAEGVDLHLDCRFVVHHDLSWNPSTIEQRTGRVDRIGSKAERTRRAIHVYLPFVTATQDEKMFRVVRDRERWFSVVMGEKYELDEAATDKIADRIPFPEEAARALAFNLAVMQDGGELAHADPASTS